MLYPNSNTSPNTKHRTIHFRKKHDNFINSDWVARIDSKYFDNATPTDGKSFFMANILGRVEHSNVVLAVTIF